MSGVLSAAAVSQLPMSGAMLGSAFLLEAPSALEPRRADADLRAVTPDYFEAMRIALVEGRTLSETDVANAPAVAVVDETLARRLWPGQSAIGRRIRWIRQSDISIEIVGVVRPVRHRGLSQPPQETVYRPLPQYPRNTMFLVARVAGRAEAAAPVLSAAVHAVDPDQPVVNTATMTSLLDRSLVQRGFGAALGAVLAMLALTLAAVGVYGMLAFAVSHRQRELGVRLALGSTPAAIVQLVMSDSVRLVVAGLVVGLPASVAAASWTQALVQGAAESDALTLVAAAAITSVLALVASYLPARRASKLDPTRALRTEG